MADELTARLLADKVRQAIRLIDEAVDVAIQENLPVPYIRGELRGELELWAARLELPEGGHQ